MICCDSLNVRNGCLYNYNNTLETWYSHVLQKMLMISVIISFIQGE